MHIFLIRKKYRSCCTQLSSLHEINEKSAEMMMHKIIISTELKFTTKNRIEISFRIWKKTRAYRTFHLKCFYCLFSILCVIYSHDSWLWTIHDAQCDMLNTIRLPLSFSLSLSTAIAHTIYDLMFRIWYNCTINMHISRISSLFLQFPGWFFFSRILFMHTPKIDTREKMLVTFVTCRSLVQTQKAHENERKRNELLLRGIF